LPEGDHIMLHGPFLNELKMIVPFALKMPGFKKVERYAQQLAKKAVGKDRLKDGKSLITRLCDNVMRFREYNLYLNHDQYFSEKQIKKIARYQNAILASPAKFHGNVYITDLSSPIENFSMMSLKYFY